MVKSIEKYGLLLVIAFLGIAREVCAQNKKIDSLNFLLKKDKEDTNKVNHINKISEAFWRLGSYDSSIAFANSALKLSQQLDPLYKRGIAYTYNILGNVNREQGNYPKALDFFLKALKTDEELKDKNGMAKRLGNIGVVYYAQGDFAKALDYYFKALRMKEELGDKNEAAKTLGNIGIIYYEQKDFSKALEYYFQALKITEELGNKNGMARHLGNIGNVYSEEAENLTGEKYAIKKDSLKQKALFYYLEALKTFEELGSKKDIALNLGNIGSLYSEQKQYQHAFDYLYRAIAVSDSIGAMDQVKSWYELLSILYEKSNVPLLDTVGGNILNKEEMRLRSLYYFKSFMNLRDTLFSEENKKQLVRKEMNFDFEKKEAATKAEQDKKDALTKTELKQKEKQRNYFIAGFALVILLAGFIFRGYRQKQKANEIISSQKLLVEEKQKEILDSIHYAKRIQQSLLPTEKYIQKNLTRLHRK